MNRATFEEYQNAKKAIISGNEYRENFILEGQTIRKTYTTQNNGTFHEVNRNGKVEFWSDKQPDSRIYEEESDQVRICIDYRMAKGQWDTAENCITTVITKFAYEQITEEQKCNCWSTNMDCVAGQRVTSMLKALVKLQGYSKLESWNIMLVEKESVQEEQQEPYKNFDRACNCWECELKAKCVYHDKYQRLGRDVGGLSKCAKLEENGGKLQY